MNSRGINRRIVGAATRLSDSYTTKDGRTLCLRLIRAEDVDRLVDFFYALSPESRWRRFHVAAEHLDQAIVRAKAQAYAAVDNGQQEGAIVALYAGKTDQGGKPDQVNAEPQIIGVARLARGVPDDAKTGAEIAVVVRDDFQQQGVGHVLLLQLVHLARTMAITHLHADIQADNQPALRVLKKLGLPIITQTRHAQTQTTITVA